MENRSEKTLRVSWVGLCSNTVLTILKLIAGVWGNSAAMVADGVHSLSDLVTDIVAIIGFKIVAKPPDANHKYGHGKFETMCSAVVGFSLMLVAAGIFWGAVCRIAAAFKGEVLPAPGMIALWAAMFSIVIKELLYRYTIKWSVKLNSPTLKANAWHHRSDALSSVGTLAGIGGAIIFGGWGRLLDPLAGVVVSLIVAKVGITITYEALSELTETSLPQETEAKIVSAVEAVPGVINIHRLRSRRLGASVALDFHLMVDPDISVREGHEIATASEVAIEGLLGKWVMTSVHVEPYEVRNDGA